MDLGAGVGGGVAIHRQHPGAGEIAEAREVHGVVHAQAQPRSE